MRKRSSSPSCSLREKTPGTSARPFAGTPASSMKRRTLFGGRGQDRIYARDGFADLVVGGRGADICMADRLDRVRYAN
jgi:hypothetical protein